MNDRSWAITKTVLAGAALLSAAIFGLHRLRHALSTGEQGLSVWFYDESEQELYAAPRDTIPPHKGIGGKAGDGVRAVVVVCRAEKDDPSKRRIAYLETHAPDLKRVLDDVKAARAAGRAYDGQVPAPDSDFFQKNTLVRRPNETAWHDIAGPEGQKIMAEWRSWACSDGQATIISTP